MLKNLGIIGWKSIELPILAGLVTGDPVLLIGSHGSAKTHGIKTIFKAMGKNLKTYDASKALFEDIIGFPIPTPESDIMKYVKTPLSIDQDTDGIFIDELSRAKASTQNKWLEVIRSRTIMGMKTPVKWVFAAMTPTSYAGTNELDEALSGRFAYFLVVPKIGEMSIQDSESVCLFENGDDAIALKSVLGEAYPNFSASDNFRQAAEKLTQTITIAQENYLAIQSKYSERIAKYITAFNKTLRKTFLTLDGRRCSMIRRNILACLSVLKAQEEDINDISDIVYQVLQFSLPIKFQNLDKIHAAATEFLKEDNSFLIEKPSLIAKKLLTEAIPIDWEAK